MPLIILTLTRFDGEYFLDVLEPVETRDHEGVVLTGSTRDARQLVLVDVVANSNREHMDTCQYRHVQVSKTWG